MHEDNKFEENILVFRIFGPLKKYDQGVSVMLEFLNTASNTSLLINCSLFDGFLHIWSIDFFTMSIFYENYHFDICCFSSDLLFQVAITSFGFSICGQTLSDGKNFIVLLSDQALFYLRTLYRNTGLGS